MAGMLPEELVTEMWVDGDNLPRKFVQDLESRWAVPVRSSTTEGTYSDFGPTSRSRPRRPTRSPRTSPAPDHSRKTRSSISCSLTSVPSDS